MKNLVVNRILLGIREIHSVVHDVAMSTLWRGLDSRPQDVSEM
jgi:hypothetical protein